MQFNKREAANWKKRTKGKLYIRDESHFRNSDLFLNNYTDIKSSITKILNGPITNQKFDVEHKDKLKVPYYKPRIGATNLNVGIRERFKLSKMNYKYEVTYKDGVFLDSLQTAGFDFALIDDEYNIVKLRNLCFGKRPLFNGEEVWKEQLIKNPYLSILADKMNLTVLPKGIDYEYAKKTPTVLGEIQFGNWGLGYRDALKVIQIERDEDVDLFVYITATGNLANLISGGTVNYKKTKTNILEQYKDILSMPIWLIGIDIK